MARRRRKHFCSYGWTSKRDAMIEADLNRQAGAKSKASRSGDGWKVCTTFRGKRRKHQRY